MAKSCRLLLPLLPLTSAFIASGPSSSFLHFRGVDSVSGLAQPVAFRLGSSAGILAPRLASSTRALSLRGGAAGVVCADDTSRTRYNFAAASGREGELVFGCERPGAADEFNKVDGIAPNEVGEWAKFMKGEGIERALCLLNSEELTFYQAPGYVGGLTAAGFAADKVTCVDVFSPGAAERTATALKAAKDAGEKLVLHCAGGEGRTGTVLAQWLKMEGLGDSEKVCADLTEYASTKNAVRKPNAAKVDRYLSAGTLGK